VLRGRLHALASADREDFGAWEADAEAPAEAPPADPVRAHAFAVLEVPPGAGPEALRRSYRRLCRRYHPDRFAGQPEKLAAATELLAEINRAYDLLVRDR
jgi:DnaJ-class molecular chaperone